MEITFVKLSRPLLIRDDQNKENIYYKTVYGFVIEKVLKAADIADLENYVGYLAGLHEESNGTDLFSIDNINGCSTDWIDKDGKMHSFPDEWTASIGQQCSEKLNLSYTFITLDIDANNIHCINDENLIICDCFFDELDNYIKGKHSSCFDDEMDEFLKSFK